MTFLWRAEEARHEIADLLGLGLLNFECPTCFRRACGEHCRWCGLEASAVVKHSAACPRVTGIYEVKALDVCCSRCGAPAAATVFNDSTTHNGSGSGQFLYAGEAPLEDLCVGCAAFVSMGMD